MYLYKTPAVKHSEMSGTHQGGGCAAVTDSDAKQPTFSHSSSSPSAGTGISSGSAAAVSAPTCCFTDVCEHTTIQLEDRNVSLVDGRVSVLPTSAHKHSAGFMLGVAVVDFSPLPLYHFCASAAEA